MEELIQELINVIKEQNASFDWNLVCSIVSSLCAVISLLAVAYLIKERNEKNRPYLQVSYELIRESLVCFVLRNTGTVPLSIKSLVFDEQFLKQLMPDVQQRIEKFKKTDIKIFPNKLWVVSIDRITSDVINNFSKKDCDISYIYTAVGKRKEYAEETNIDFDAYSGMLIYISEIGELTDSIKKLDKVMKSINKTQNHQLGFQPSMDTYIENDEQEKTTV